MLPRVINKHMRLTSFYGMYVTGLGKTLRNEFFLKIQFDVWLISSTIELTLTCVFRLIARIVVEIEHFVCDRATPP